MDDKLWKMEIRDPRNGQNPFRSNADVILASGPKEAALNLVPSPSPNVTSYHVILDELHVVNRAASPLEFQSILAELTSLKIRATYYSHGSVTFKEITLETAVRGLGTSGEMKVGFVENATCHMNYTGLSCQKCAQGFTREVNGSGLLGRCVLCSCNNRSTQCDGETGVCANCKVGTYGDRCQLCTSNVRGPECSRCETGYWGLSVNGCQACHCYTPGTIFGNDTSCHQVTGQCKCNATANIGGRRCDTCRENSWNTSAVLFNCKECPTCYSSVEEDVNLLRVHISSLQVQLSSFLNQPAMLHNRTFVERLRQLVTEISGLTQTINAAQEANSNSTAQWLLFSVAMNDVSAVLNETITIWVNRTLHSTAVVEGNKRETEATVTEIQGIVTEASHFLETAIGPKFEQAETTSNSLANLAGQLANLKHSIKLEENRTVLANKTIRSRVEHAVEIANKSAEMARNVTDTQAHVAALLRQLQENASAAHVLRERTVAMASDMLATASRAYDHSLQKLNETSQANPNRSGLLEDMKREAAIARDLSSQYHRQVSDLYQSSTAVINQVNAAIERSIVQDEEVQAVYNNASQVHQDSHATLTAAQAAVSRTRRLDNQAQRMLQVVQNFENESLQAQASANKALSGIPRIRNTTHEIITEVSMANQSSANTLSTAAEALRLGSKVHNLSVSEKEVAERALRLANQLDNETSTEDPMMNNTVENFIVREIEPVLKLCQNLSTMAFNASNNSSALLRRAVYINATVQRLGVLIRRLLRREGSTRQVGLTR